MVYLKDVAHILCFGCFSMQSAIERYREHAKQVETNNPELEQYMQVRHFHLWFCYYT